MLTLVATMPGPNNLINYRSRTSKQIKSDIASYSQC
uniref:Uncharacterized protein n=1 Tax=Anguilla anguilla TaxID=7936 RepID=A0A0E9XBF4_ANGAN